ncbi:MAG: LptE family protein [Verrucomicrobia bacterium]|nr:LptE family protein [Verrucomicrobiota bacterium]
MKLHTAALLAVILAAITGCSSYHLGSVHDPGFKTIFIENFKSEVDEPALENLVTTTVIQQFQRDGTLQVADPKEADVILRGRITSFKMSPVRYSRANEVTPTEASMSIGVRYTLTKHGETKPYHEGEASGETSFFIGSDLQSDKRQGVPLASEKLGRNMVAALVEGW